MDDMDGIEEEDISEEDLEDSFEDPDEMIDVVEDHSDEDEEGEDALEDVAKLRGALRSLSFSAADEDEDMDDEVGADEDEDLDAPPLPPPSPPRRPKRPIGPKSVTEYVRRGARIAAETVAVPSWDSFDLDLDEDVAIQLQPEDARMSVLLQFLNADFPSIRELRGSRNLLAVLSVRLVVRRMHERAAGDSYSKERAQERWTRREARAFLAAIAPEDAASAASAHGDPPQTVSERSIQLTAQISAAMECLAHLARALLLAEDDAVPGCSLRFSGMRFHGLLAADAGVEVKLDERLWGGRE